MENINGILFKSMLESGSNNLMNQFAYIDSLNVFPVPDGDTGTNMSLTFSAGVADALKANSDTVGDIAKALSKGLLMGARGNSGVILSQIFRGVYQAIDTNETINPLQLANAFVNGSRVAYKAVMRPVEGTILTVIREASDYTFLHISNQPDATLVDVMEKLVEEAKISLDGTPELLPVLKEVGVVDSGGAGLLVILEGMLSVLKGKSIALLDVSKQTSTMSASNMESDEFGYCTEFIIRLNEESIRSFSESTLRDTLSKLGDSIVVVQDEDIVKVHIHTLTPGDALNAGQVYGEFAKLKIENMQEQHENIISDTTTNEPSEYALIAVAAGEGLSDMFKELRVSHIISGGQTMNPSTEDFVEAIKNANAKQVYILPNNSNIILAAQQAAQVMEEYNVSVIPSKSIPQGLCACMMFNPEVDAQTNVNEMSNALTSVKTGQVTYAIKDTTFEGMEIKANDYMGIFEKDIVVSLSDKQKTVFQLLDAMMDEESEIVTLIAGEDTSEDEMNAVVEYIEEKGVEVELTEGNQPVYSYIIGVE